MLPFMRVESISGKHIVIILLVVLLSGCVSQNNTPSVTQNPISLKSSATQSPISLKLGYYQIDFLLSSNYDKKFKTPESSGRFASIGEYFDLPTGKIKKPTGNQDSVGIWDLDDDFKFIEMYLKEYDTPVPTSMDILRKDLMYKPYGEISTHTTADYTYLVKETEDAFMATCWLNNRTWLMIRSLDYSGGEFFEVMDSLKATRTSSPAHPIL
jgi:hypothetical protein